MGNKDILEGFLSDLDIGEQRKKTKPKVRDYILEMKDELPKEDFLGDIQKRSVDSLKESQKEILDLIEERRILTKEIATSIDKIVSQINTMTISVSATDPEAMAEKLNLLKKKADLEEMKVKEKLECWRDIALLKKELREWNSELRGKESESRMLNDILD